VGTAEVLDLDPGVADGAAIRRPDDRDERLALKLGALRAALGGAGGRRAYRRVNSEADSEGAGEREQGRHRDDRADRRAGEGGAGG